jgi:lipid II:glycine glycyltransferase (peptidoglycan interpeptide bridge formation enzyme)
MIRSDKIEKITIHEYKPEFKAEWDKFVDESNIGTMFHKQAFLDYHEPGKFEFHNLMFRRGDELVGVMPAGLKDNGSVLWSPMGASYGSVVVKDIAFDLSLEIIDTLLDYSKDRFKEIYLIPPPLIYNKIYNQHLEYSMLYRKFDFENHYISHAIDLKLGDNCYDNFDKKTKMILRKIQREGKLEIRESDSMEEFYPILEENKAKHNVKPTHSLEDLNRLKELIPQHLKLFMVYYEGKPIAGSLLFLANEKVALCFYIMMKYEYKHLKPVFLAQYHSARWAQENGYHWFDIGVSQDTAAEDPMTPSLSLIYFKERFNARGIFRSTFHYKFKD